MVRTVQATHRCGVPLAASATAARVPPTARLLLCQIREESAPSPVIAASARESGVYGIVGPRFWAILRLITG
jgi:hypothetical protein